MINYQLLLGDNRDTLKTLPDKSVHCCVTSPPYFGLRDYGHDGQIGLEATPELYVAEIVAVFREVWRVLRDDGTVWLNLGDSYAGGGLGGGSGGKSTLDSTHHRKIQGEQRKAIKPHNGLKPKDLIGIPWRVAFALQADGWYLRQDIIWHKPNPMPESVTDRCTKAHEYIFLLSKSERYYYDAEAVKEESAGQSGRAADFCRETKEDVAPNQSTKQHRLGRKPTSDNGTRNRRSVWTVATQPYSGAHFATFPPKLIEPCILAGCPVGGTVLDPFGGSGTTAAVSISHGRNAILCELNPEYGELIKERVGAALAEYQNAAGDYTPAAKENKAQLSLFW